LKRLAACAGLVLASQAWASHPLITEDMGVLDKGGWQLELHGEKWRDQDTRVGERESLWHASAAVLFAATGKLKLVLDLGRDTNPDPASHTAIRENVYGLIYGITGDIDLGLGLKKGLSDPANDQALLAGLKFRW